MMEPSQFSLRAPTRFEKDSFPDMTGVLSISRAGRALGAVVLTQDSLQDLAYSAMALLGEIPAELEGHLSS